MSQHDSKFPEIRRADYAALREVLRGYFHQDMNDEYGSVENAVKQFAKDADPAQRALVSKEWNRLLAHFKDRPLSELNRALTLELGSAHALEPADLEQISNVFRAEG